MKILIITRNAWDDTNAIGNTISNFFSPINNVEIANVFFRSASPNNSVCSTYYRITEFDIVKFFFQPHKIGRRFYLNKDNNINFCNNAPKEKRIVSFIHRHGLKFIYKISDFFWYRKKWINNNLREFISSYKPDLVFSFVKSSPQYFLMIEFLIEEYHIPLFSWIADDEYSCLMKEKKYTKISHLNYILQKSDFVGGCTKELCDYYNNIFGCNATPIYKSCSFNSLKNDFARKMLKIVYAGNLLYGRLELLIVLSDIFQKYSENNKKVSFEIFSNTLISNKEKLLLEKFTCVKYHGSTDYDIVTKHLSSADLVLHVESFKASQIIKTKYSFSTKIIDCLQSGAVILAVGPNEVASINYIKNIPGACVISDLQNLRDEIYKLFNNSFDFGFRAAQIRDFAIKNHSKEMSVNKFNEILFSITGDE